MKRITLPTLILLTLLASLPIAQAGVTQQSITITNINNDLVTVQLRGAGTMTVSLVNGGLGPIDQINLAGTDATSSLIIKVKKTATGTGRIAVNAITGAGTLRSINGKTVDIVGDGIHIGGALGLVKLGHVLNSALIVDGAGVTSNGFAIACLSAGVVSNSTVVIGGRLGKTTLTALKSSTVFVGYTPADPSQPIKGGTFDPAAGLTFFAVKGDKTALGAAFVDSVVAAQDFAKVSLASVATNNAGRACGLVAGNTFGEVAINTPKTSWRPSDRIAWSLGDFQLRRAARFVFTPQTKRVADADAAQAVVGPDRLVFPANAASVQGVAVGDILISGYSTGYVRRVTAVVVTPVDIQFQTTPATWAEAITEGAFSETLYLVSAEPEPAPAVSAAANAVSATSGLTSDFLLVDRRWTDRVLYDENGVIVTLDEALMTLRAKVTIEGEFRSGLRYLYVETELDADAGVTVSSVGALHDDGETRLFTIPTVVFPTPLGINFNLDFDLYAGFEADLDFNARATGDFDGLLRVGARWDRGSGWSRVATNSLRFTTTLNNAEANGSIAVYLRPTLGLAPVSDQVLPEATFSLPIGLELTGEMNVPQQRYCWDLDGFLSGDLLITWGWVLDWLLDPYEINLFSKRWDIANRCLNNPVPPGMALIPAGGFAMGDTFSEGDPDEQPVHTVYVSAFYMDKYEVSKALWDSVATWAASNGYDISPSSASGKAANHPAYYVSWYEAVKWCNARSEKEGLTPCYYTSAAKTTIYKTGNVDVANDWVNWNANGYRLPTEAEWEKAARGSLSGNVSRGATLSRTVRPTTTVRAVTPTTSAQRAAITRHTTTVLNRTRVRWRR